jgi:hypothetical protein
MSDAYAAALAVAAAAGALWAQPFPVPVAVGAVVLAFIIRRPALLVLAVALLTAGLGARSLAGLHPPRLGPFEGTVTLLGDPTTDAGQTRVEVRVDGKRVEAWAHGRAAAALEPRLAGERVVLRGRLQPVSPASQARLVPRHVAARLSVQAVGAWSAGDASSRAANAVHCPPAPSPCLLRNGRCFWAS